MNEHGAIYVVVSVLSGVLYAGDDKDEALETARRTRVGRELPDGDRYHEAYIETWISGRLSFSGPVRAEDEADGA